MPDIESLIERAFEAHQAAHAALGSAVVTPSVPVLYFGNASAYLESPLRVVTVGLNPSLAEFPSSAPFERFPHASDADRRSYRSAIDHYFEVKPLTRWFGTFEGLLRGLDVSFDDSRRGVALHTDIGSPVATDPTWSRLGFRQRSSLEELGTPLWHDLIREFRPQVMLVSVAARWLDLIQFPVLDPWRTIFVVERTNPYVVRAQRVEIDGGHTCLLVFGRAAQLPFGSISKKDKVLIGEAVRRSMWRPATDVLET